MTRWHINYTKINMKATRPISIHVKHFSIHVICWLVFIFYENLLLIGLKLQTPDFIPLLVHTAANITFFYAFAWIILYWAWRADHHQWWRILIGVILSLMVYIVIKTLIDDGIPLLGGVDHHLFIISLRIFSGYLYRGMFFILCAMGYCYLIRFIKERHQRELLLASYFNHQLSISKGHHRLNKCRQDLLYTQLNMHHLFSCLNFIYLKLASQDDHLALLSLYSTNLVRYYMDQEDAKGSDLAKNLVQVKNLIEMDQMMHPQQAPLHLIIEKEIENLKVDTCVLIPLTVLLMHYSTTIKNKTRGKFSIFMVNERLYLKGENIQYIEEPNKLGAEFEQLHHQIISHQMHVEKFEYLIIHHTLNFDIIF